jgi:hypothetical protein
MMDKALRIFLYRVSLRAMRPERVTAMTAR